MSAAGAAFESRSTDQDETTEGLIDQKSILENGGVMTAVDFDT